MIIVPWEGRQGERAVRVKRRERKIVLLEYT